MPFRRALTPTPKSRSSSNLHSTFMDLGGTTVSALEEIFGTTSALLRETEGAVKFSSVTDT